LVKTKSKQNKTAKKMSKERIDKKERGKMDSITITAEAMRG